MSKYLKYIILILSIYLTNCTKAQTNTELVVHQIRQYSYPLLQLLTLKSEDGSVTYSYQGYGTGFFYRKKNRLFLVTANHIITGIDVYNKKRTNIEWNNVAIRYTDTTGIVRLYGFNVDSMKSHTQIFSYDEAPDVFVYEIRDTLKDAQIYSVEKMCNKKYQVGDQEEVFAFGYSSYKKTIENLNIETLNMTAGELYYGIKTDSLIQLHGLEKASKLNFFSIPATVGGSSGSPAFVLHSKSKTFRRPKIVFAGLQTGANFFHNYGIFVDKNQVLKAIKAYISAVK